MPRLLYAPSNTCTTSHMHSLLHAPLREAETLRISYCIDRRYRSSVKLLDEYECRSPITIYAYAVVKSMAM